MTNPSDSSSHLPPPVPTAPPGVAPAGVTPRPGVAVGRVVSVEVTAVSPGEIEVKLADGRSGVIARSDLGDEPLPSVGQTVDAALLARDDPRHRVVLSRSWAVKLRRWEAVEAAMASGEPMHGVVTRAIKGGFIVDLGLRAFLPSSMAGIAEGGDGAELVGTETDVVVTEVNRALDRVVVSRRDLLRRQRRQAERDVFGSLVVGERVTGTVVGLVEYGAHVDLGGVRALLHRTEMSWGRVARPGDVVAVGDRVEAVVIAVNRSKRRISLSIRQLAPDPYAALEVGSIRTAVVTRVVEYGVFARIDDTDIVGLVHMSELTDLPGYRPDEVVTPGEQVHVKVLGVDLDKRRVSLSVRQALLA
ncbi:MAG: S1 RNA-binding domain-containing protein [Acidimicrobiales bacterium]